MNFDFETNCNRSNVGVGTLTNRVLHSWCFARPRRLLCFRSTGWAIRFLCVQHRCVWHISQCWTRVIWRLERLWNDLPGDPTCGHDSFSAWYNDGHAWDVWLLLQVSIFKLDSEVYFRLRNRCCFISHSITATFMAILYFIVMLVTIAGLAGKSLYKRLLSHRIKKTHFSVPL